MSWDAIQAAAQVQAAAGPRGIEGPLRAPEAMPAPAASPGFGALVTDGLAKLNGELLTTQTDLQQLAVGDVQNLHQIMIRMEESRLSFELMLHVRNRVLEAYQDLMKMQV
jgi:flagellar hook-basal body complex protein FliE